MLLIESHNNQVLAQITKLKNDAEQGTRKSLYDIGKHLSLDARRFIDEKPKHGRVYKVGIGIKAKKLKRLRDHTASAPGEAPAVITGNLRKAVDFHVQGSTQIEVGVASSGNARHGAGVNYAKYLEYQNLIAASGAGGSKKNSTKTFY